MARSKWLGQNGSGKMALTKMAPYNNGSIQKWLENNGSIQKWLGKNGSIQKWLE
jgi:hypothetical protein